MTRRAEERGLRERKKRQTRDRLAEVSLRLFIRDGFEKVTVAQIADAAELSPATVFNYFSTKEDLVFERLDRFWEGFLSAVAERPEGARVVDAAERFLVSRGSPEPSEGDQVRLEAVSRMIADSPSLLARERASYDVAARRLSELIAEEDSWIEDAAVIAHMILGVHRSLVAFVREQVLAGVEREVVNAAAAERTRRGFGLLRTGIDA